MAVRIPEPGSQASRQIVVWEPRPWWTPRLQRRFLGSDIAVRSVAALADVIEAAPGVVIFDASANPEGMVRNCVEVERRNDGVFVIIIVPPDLRPAEWRLREIGADVVVVADIGGDELASLCRHALRTEPGDGSPTAAATT